MLPSLISSDIASLHGNKDRLAMTVMWELHVTRPDGYPADESDFDRPVTESTSSSWYDNFIISIPDDPCWCGRTVIKSKAAMTYEQADQLISSGNIYDQPDNVPVGQAGRPVCKTLFPRLIPDLRVLTLVSRALKKRRELSGSVNFSRGDEGGGGELRFDLQGGNGPTAVEASKHLEVHDTIAELMILSNSAVAKIISEALPVQALVRIHAPPPLHKLENVRDFCEQIGVNVFRSPNATELIKQIPKFHSLLLGDSNKGQTAVGRRDALELMTSVLIRAMSEAAYVSTGSLVGDMAVVSNTTSDAVKSEELVYKGKHELRKGHYGLGVLHYTHFTSPIRRYADVVVHRQLLFALQQPNVALRWETSRDAIINSSSEIGVISDLVSEGSAENEVNLDNFMDSLLEDVGDSLIVPTKPAQNSSYASALVVEAKSSSTDRLHSTIEKDSESFGASISMPPYTGSELFKIANELNILNRNSKWVQSACQKLFLTLYFKNKMQLFDAVIYGVKENGILVYVPCFDFKGSIMFCTKKGVVRLHKNLLKHLDKIEFSQCQELRGFIKSSFADDIIECPELMCELKRSRNHDSLRAVDREEDTKTSVLRIIRRRTAICAEQSILDLVPLQKIQVLMTTKSYSGGGSDIELILHSITHLKSSVKDDSSTFVKERSTINEIGASIAADCLSPTVSEFKITEIKPQRASPSLYEHIHVSIDHIASLIGVSSSFNKERYKKVLSDSKTVEYRIKGTGRICFDGDYKDESNFASEMFLSNGNDSSRKQAKSEASNAGFLTGKAAALDKMKLWGEEWAEEEDLPGTITREDEISDEGDLDMGQSGPIAYQIGGGRRISEPDRSSNHAANNFGRTVALASQRQHKLKVAKRNSKYN